MRAACPHHAQAAASCELGRVAAKHLPHDRRHLRRARVRRRSPCARVDGAALPSRTRPPLLAHTRLPVLGGAAVNARVLPDVQVALLEPGEQARMALVSDAAHAQRARSSTNSRAALLVNALVEACRSQPARRVLVRQPHDRSSERLRKRSRTSQTTRRGTPSPAEATHALRTGCDSPDAHSSGAPAWPSQTPSSSPPPSRFRPSAQQRAAP